MGDSLYDQHMVDGLLEDTGENFDESESPVVLKIGFLNGKVGIVVTIVLKVLNVKFKIIPYFYI